MIRMKILNRGEFFGVKKKAINHNGLLITENETFLKEVPWHFHENAHFFYVLKGNVTEVNKKDNIFCEPGTLIYQNWEEPHYNKDASIVHSLNVEIGKEWIAKFCLEENLLSGSLRLLNPAFRTIFKKMHRELFINDKFSLIAIEGLVLQSFAEIHRIVKITETAIPAWVDKAREYLNYEKTEPISLKHLAELIGVHPVYLSKAFPRYFHSTFGDYLRRNKIQKAISLMAGENYSFTEISYECGFSDQSHFIKCFKQIYGITPSEYKNASCRN